MAKNLDEAFNRVISFCPELLMPGVTVGDPLPITIDKPPRTAFNRVTANGEFDWSDIGTLIHYTIVVHKRVHAKYPPDRTDDQAVGIRQACKNLVDTVAETAAYVSLTMHKLEHTKHEHIAKNH